MIALGWRVPKPATELCNTNHWNGATGQIPILLRTVRCKITGYLNILCNHRFFSATQGAFVASLNGMVVSNCVMPWDNSVGCVNEWRGIIVGKGCTEGKLGMLPASHTEWCSMPQPAHALIVLSFGAHLHNITSN
jgi:hypothetical protein